MYELPTTVKLGDNTFHIRKKGDYRMVLDCFEALNDVELSQEERIISSLIIFYEELNDLNDVNELTNLDDLTKEMFKFMNSGRVDTHSSSSTRLYDWEYDSTIICAAINNVCGKEIRAESYIHWWTFMGYFLSIGESTFSNVVGIRSKRAKHKKLEKYEQEFVRDNPNYFNLDLRNSEQKEMDDYVKSLWNK